MRSVARKFVVVWTSSGVGTIGIGHNKKEASNCVWSTSVDAQSGVEVVAPEPSCKFACELEGLCPHHGSVRWYLDQDVGNVHF
ncbi:hypothetical protein SLA2020_377090 [Shorea laevis]